MTKRNYGGLSFGEIKREILRATAGGESVSSYALCDRLCRADAVGRLSRTDAEDFDTVLNEMVASGEVQKLGPFISRGR